LILLVISRNILPFERRPALRAQILHGELGGNLNLPFFDKMHPPVAILREVDRVRRNGVGSAARRRLSGQRAGGNKEGGGQRVAQDRVHGVSPLEQTRDIAHTLSG
jgi:hypothetical protein